MTDISITNNHLKLVVEEVLKYLKKGEEPPLELMAGFISELKVSNLIAPVVEEGEFITFENIEFEETEDTYIPVFTDMEEYEKHTPGEEEYVPMPLDFSVYIDAVLDDDEVDGIFLNPLGDFIPIDSAFMSDIEIEMNTLDETGEPYSADELKELFDGAANDSLVEFIKSEDNDDIEKLYVELSNSTMLGVLVNAKPIDGLATDGIIEIKEDDDFNMCIIGDDDLNLGVMFTDRKAIEKLAEQDPDLYYCGHIVKVSQLFDFILRSDMDGVVINPYSDDYMISRDVILPQATGIEIIVDDKRLEDTVDYAFLL